MKKVAKLLVMIALFASLAGCAKNPSITIPGGVLEFTVGDKDFTSENIEEKLLVGVTGVDNDNQGEAALKVIDLGGFDINKIGEYTITIQALSKAKKSVTATRQVKVVDRTLPVLNVPNGTLEFYEKDETFTSEKLLEGVTVTDAVDDDIEPTVTNLGGFDIAVPGEYVITITATNTGNKTVTATRTVHVLERSLPVITSPAEQVNLIPGVVLSEGEVLEALKAKGFMVEDEYDPAPAIKIENLSAIDFATEGNYQLNITVTDKYGKTSEATIEISVYQNKAPEIISTGVLVMNRINDSDFNSLAFLEEFRKGIIIKDDFNTFDISDDGSLEIDVEILDLSQTFRPSVKGEYTYQFTATDAQGLKVTGNKIVKVVDPADRVVVIGNDTFDVSSASNYMLNGTLDPNNYQVAVYTYRGETEMMLPASGHAWMLDGNRKLVQVLAANELGNVEMNPDNLLIIFGKNDSVNWASDNESLNQTVTLFNFNIYELLDAPVITEQESMLSWNAVEGASQYQVYMNGELYTTVNETSFDLTTVNGITAAENIFQIKAVSGNNRSLLSNEVIHTYTLTASVVDVATMWFEKDGNRNDAEGDVLVWNSVENASQYRIYVDGKYVGTVASEAGITKYQYDLKSADNSSWRKIPENYNFYDELGIRYPYLDNFGNPIYENGEIVYKPLSTQTYNSWAFAFTVEAWVPNAVIAQSDPIDFIVNRITQPKLFASKYEIGGDDVYDGIPEYNLAAHPVFIPGGTFAQFDQHLIANDSFIVISQSGMEHMTSMSYKVNGNLEIMRLYPQTISEYASNGILTPIPALGVLGLPGIYDQPAYVTSLSMLTMPKSALLDLALLKAGALTPDTTKVYYDAGAGDFFGVTFNPSFLMDPASTNDKFMLYGPATGQSGVCVWSQLIFNGDNARWYNSLPSERMLLTVPGQSDLVGSTIMNYAPGTYEIIE